MSNNYEDYNQPVIDEKFFKNGKNCRTKMKEKEAHKQLELLVESNKLTSDQYDSFWLGWFWDNDPKQDSKQFLD